MGESKKTEPRLNQCLVSGDNPFFLDEVIHQFINLFHFNERIKLRKINKQWKKIIDVSRHDGDYFYPAQAGQLVIKSKDMSRKKLVKAIADFSQEEGAKTGAAIREIMKEDLLQMHDDFYHFLYIIGPYVVIAWAVTT